MDKRFAKPSYRHGNYFYYTRTVKGLSYRLECRKPVLGKERLPQAKAEETVLLDVNEMAEGKKHCDVVSVRPSPDHELLAFTADYTGEDGLLCYVYIG